MDDAFAHIRTLIEQGAESEARDLLREQIRTQPSAEAYYLASRVAYNEEQRKLFLEDALAIDPAHPAARAAYDRMNAPAPAPNAATPYTPYPYGQPAATAAAIDIPLADISARFIAFFIDNVLLAIIAGAAGACIGIFLIASDPEAQLPTNIALLISLVIQSAYYAYFLTTRNGQTPGKAFVKIRIVKRDGTPFTATDAVVRNVIGYFLSNVVFFLGFIWAFFDPQRQCWHDKMADTLVVRDLGNEKPKVG